ncbi:MAG: cobalamin-dependent protein, partial [Promethearchaeota archaeon]
MFNWETELDNPQRRSIFMQSARYRNGILDYVDLPLREPPTGLMLLAAVLESKGYSVEIVDATLLENVDDFLENNLQKFRVIGFTGLTNTFPFIEKIIQRTNQINPEIYIILGGPHASFQYEEILQSLPEVDLICIGEAENT